MATKTDKIFIQIGDEVIELKGKELEEFLLYRKEIALFVEAEQKALEQIKNNKISAYTKLGLTEEEINAIL